MKEASPLRVLLIQDDKETACCVEERLVSCGLAVETAQHASAGAAIRNRGAYNVLCIDLSVPGTELLPVLRAFAEEGELPPTLMITGPDTMIASLEFLNRGPVCHSVRDIDGRYLDVLPCLIERLSALETLTREKQEVEKALRETEERLFMSQKMEAIGMLAGGIAHDFNNILATILGYASFLKGKATQDDIFFDGLSAIEDSAVRASELTSQIQAYSRGGKTQIKTLSINRVIGDVYRLIQKTFDKSIRITLDLDEGISTIDADTAQMKHMVLNLSINARDVMPKGGVLTIKTFMSHIPDNRIGAGEDIPPGEYVGMSVSDTGAGMDEETRRRVFEPYFSKKKGEGTTGLGLSVVYGIVKGHGGLIDVKSEIGVGTEFVILLHASKKKEEAPVTETEAVGGGSETILVVDDETQIVQMLKRVLTDFGFQVLCSDSGAEGVGIFEEKGKEIDLVILDIMMPRMGGKEVMNRLLSLRPDIKILLASGFSEQDRHYDLMAMGAAGFIGKPFVIQNLLKKIRDILG